MNRSAGEAKDLTLNTPTAFTEEGEWLMSNYRSDKWAMFMLVA